MEDINQRASQSRCALGVRLPVAARRQSGPRLTGQMDVDLRGLGEWHPQEIQGRKADLKQRRQGMLDRGALRGDAADSKFSQLVDHTDGPERRALRICAMHDLEACGLAMANQAIPREENEMTRGVISAPGAIPEDSGIERVEVRRLDPDASPRA